MTEAIIGLSASEQQLVAAAGDVCTASDTNTLFGANSDLPMLLVESAHCRAVISLYGAQLLSFAPAGQRDFLWLSPLERFQPGQAIRGGIPVCAPWFGVNRRENSLPKHGFLRNRRWILQSFNAADEQVELSLAYQSTEEDLSLFAWPIRAELRIILGRELEQVLSISNLGESAMPLSFALHSYLSVSDVGEAKVCGLDQQMYLDNCQGLSAFVQSGEVSFPGEVDRVYESQQSAQQLVDGQRTLSISGVDCETVIVWNPGAELAQQMADVGAYHKDYVCVERGRAFADEVILGAGERHEAVMRLASVD
ncbi:D-hexose-6-phosphate mutarotase [Spongiibacter sp. KMU-158]|uniref:Putative glucose-6-phosphate 1-epimerase n=1 Tax=Spongiibacter pelagi TaxID=2760804 RepID=A0A927C2Q8_9GAMM|nr:D-hexose-6-phosphate mutarotase [Spongiibacter pelagi]MBD2858696.1 D-hexose-6-phosphate mutarotase [Spongiibacter pelagi]